MQPTTWRRALLLFALLLAFSGSFALLRTTLLSPLTPPTATPLTSCPTHPSFPPYVIIAIPAASPRDPTLLSLNLPAPILVVPSHCP